MPPLTPPLSDNDLLDILSDILTAEAKGLPGSAKHEWVKAEQARKRATSPTPDWIWLVCAMLDKIIPILVDYLKAKFGDTWPEKAARFVQSKTLPWQKPNSHPS